MTGAVTKLDENNLHSFKIETHSIMFAIPSWNADSMTVSETGTSANVKDNNRLEKVSN